MSYKKFVAGFDVHGDQQCEKTNDIFFKFITQWNPDFRIAGGDIFDFRPLRGKASIEERRESVRGDRDAGMEWLTRFQPTHLLLGNHDNRLWLTAEKNDGVLSDFCQQGINEIEDLCKSFKCRIYPYHKRHGILKLGHLKVIHGFACGVYAARQTALVYGSCLFGHTHSIDEHSIPGLERRVARACGCLCNLDLDYSSTNPSTLRQAHGFAYGVIDDRSGAYHVWQAESIGGKWILPSDIVQYK